ncbi:hypothetical protein SAMN05443252_10339 [Bacillus sp. OV322]|nr:hypothetical protein SAMN05443252_10339 [Bacillus sp. OV322]
MDIVLALVYIGVSYVKESNTMNNKRVHLLFIKELGRLLNEFNNCDDDQVKNIIYQDIFLLRDALHLTAIK